MKLFFHIIFGILFLYLLYLVSFSALNGEVIFSNDVARNFLLLQELDEKKIVLIGPRSSTQGLFYSSFLTYFNYPAYLIGQGNPVIVAWFWVFVSLIVFITSFFMVRKLFGTIAASFYVLIIAAKLVPKSSEIFEPMAMYWVMPVFLFTIIEYVRTKKLMYLIGHIISLSIFIHLSIGIGLQFLILSFTIIFYIVFESRKWKHLLSFLIIPVSLINIILFDIKYGFGMTKALLGTGSATRFFVSIPDWIGGRVHHATSLQLLDSQNFLWIPIFLTVMFFTYLSIKKDKKSRHIYILFLLYYFGYMTLSYFNKGILLVHYIYLLIPFTAMWLVSFLNGKYKTAFIPIVLVVLLLNIQFAQNFTKNLKASYIGKVQDSWVGLSNTARDIAKTYEGKEFGYYVFAPDAYAYQPRYAMLYHFKKEGAKAFEYKKMETTLVIAQAPPSNDKYMDYKWWVKVPVRIANEPKSIKDFPNGYKVLEYKLTKDEQKIPHDITIELGIHFR